MECSGKAMSQDFMKIHQISKDQLPGMVRPMICLSKERPILGDHPKAHIHAIWQIFTKFGRFHVKSTDIAFPTALHKTEEFLLSYFDL